MSPALNVTPGTKVTFTFKFVQLGATINLCSTAVQMSYTSYSLDASPALYANLSCVLGNSLAVQLSDDIPNQEYGTKTSLRATVRLFGDHRAVGSLPFTFISAICNLSG
jgi:hypothetical protein